MENVPSVLGSKRDWGYAAPWFGLLLQFAKADAVALYAKYTAQGVEFIRGLGNMPWHCREFVLKDCDRRLLAFGANL